MRICNERTKAGMERARLEGRPIGKRGPDKKRRKKRSQKTLAPTGAPF